MWFSETVAQRGQVTKWDPVIVEYGGTPSMVALIKAVIATESSWDPDAVNAADPSYGLMQVLHGPRGAYPGVPVETLRNPVSNIQLGATFLLDKVRQWGATSDAISAYNAGRPLRLPEGGYRNQAYVDTVQTYWTWYLNHASPIAWPADPPPLDMPAPRSDPAGSVGSGLGIGAVILAALGGIGLWLWGKG